MSWGEAWRLTGLLSMDPGSAVGAALNDFDRPTSREALVVMDLYDSHEAARIGRKAKRYPRPWGDKTRRVIGRTRMTPKQLRAVLDDHRATTDTEGGGERG